MRANDRVVLIVVPLIALCVAFWLLLIAPKRNEASDLQQQIDTTNAAVLAAQQEVTAAEAARKSFPETYGRLVELGRAVPADNDQSTLVYDMTKTGQKNELDFVSFEAQPGSGATAGTPAPPPPDSTATDSSQSGTTDPAVTDPATSTAASTTTTAPVPATAPATEASASTLPLGAAVGTAGLPVLPYQFKYTGNFFKVADFLGDVDSTVTTKTGEPVVHGRLMTVDGFALIGNALSTSGAVQANFAVTTYVVPQAQGLTAGATPAGPAPVTSDSTATPVSTSAPTSVPTPTAAATAP